MALKRLTDDSNLLEVANIGVKTSVHHLNGVLVCGCAPSTQGDKITATEFLRSVSCRSECESSRTFMRILMPNLAPNRFHLTIDITHTQSGRRPADACSHCCALSAQLG